MSKLICLTFLWLIVYHVGVFGSYGFFFPLIMGVGGRGGGDDAPGIREDYGGGVVVTTVPGGRL